MAYARLLTWVLLPLCAFRALAFDHGALDGYIRAEMEMNRIPGLSLAVVSGDSVLALRAYGVKSLATGEPMTVHTPVELASVSKAFTAVAVLQLSESGRLELDAPIARYLPGFQIGDDPAAAEITVRHLLRHTSGLRRYDDRLVPCCGRPGEFDLDVAVHRLRAARLRQPPGAGFRYANSNYVLLAAIVERVSGEPFPSYMHEHVIRPLGMTRTTLHRSEALAWGLADPHERRWGRLRPSDSKSFGWYGASMVKSTAADMARYLAALLNGGLEGFNGSPPLAARVADRNDSPYDMGWFIRTEADWLNQSRVIEHTGDIWGGNTAAVLAPHRKLAAVVLINAGAHRAGDIARNVLARAAGLPAPEARAAHWSSHPDNWAICFTIAAVLLLLSLTAQLHRARRELRSGRRKFRWNRSAWEVGRLLVLVAMAGYLVYLLLGGGRIPVTSLPGTLTIGLRLLCAAVAALLLSTGVLTFAPRLRKPAP